MSIQSAFTSQPLAEAPVARSRAGQTEPREGGEVFALPETGPDAAGQAKAGATGKTVAPGEAGVSKEAAAAVPAVDPAKVSAQVDKSLTAAEPVAAPASANKPELQTAKVDASGIAFLIAMAAAQTGVQTGAAGEEPATKPGEVGEGAAKKDGKAAAEGEAGVTTGTPMAESQAAAVPVVILPPMVLPQGALLAVDAAAGDAAEAMTAEGGAKKDAGKPAFAAAAVGLPLVAIATPDAAQAGLAGAMEGKAASGAVHAVGMAGQGAQEFADILAKADQPAAAGAAPAPAEAKALDALQQQPATPFDLSTLLQQTPGKAGHERLIQPFDPNTAPGAPGQGTASSQPTPIHVVPIEIGLRVMSGSRQFDIRLDPDELGRVDVSLSISDKGEVSARLVVDRVETLHLLQRDARTLERAFEQAGLKPSDSGVDITLRDPSDQSAFRQNRQQDEAPQRSRQPDGSDLADDAPLSIDPAPQRRLIRLGGVDLSI
ncbi:MAG: flagellar hook-length control protein FliK [Proteobacteria bacterium]|nr:flagellar hook-length control protein FliK [Pseudomonadota bacterium]